VRSAAAVEATGAGRRGLRTFGTLGLAVTMTTAVVGGTLAALAAGPAPVAGAATTVPNPDPSLITRWAPCQPGAGVTELVDYGPLGNGKVDVGCAPTAAAQADGFQALDHAGFTHATRPSTPGFLTTITGCPGTSCPVVGTIPSGAYWSYWVAKAPGDAWGYSEYGGAAPETNGTAYPFQAWAFGNSTEPRAPVMNSTGPVAARPAPEPTAGQALALAEGWVTTVFSHLAAQCVAHQSTCSSEQYANLDDYVEALTAAGVPTDQIDRTVLALLRSGQAENAMATEAPTFISLGGLTTENGAAPLLSALTSLHTSSDTTEIDTLAARIQETLQPTGRYPGSVRLAPTTNEPTTNYPTPTTPTTPTKPVVATAVQAPVVNALLAAGVAVPVTAVDAVISYTVGPLATTATKGTTSGVKRLSQQLVALVAILDATPAKITGGGVTPGEVGSKIAADASALAAAQKADGGFNGGYAGGGPSEKVETAYLTGFATQGLAAAAQATGTATTSAAARAGSRWLASMQLTAAAVGIGGGSTNLGFVATDPDFFTANAANGLGYDPATLDYSGSSTHSASGLLTNTLWDIDHAMDDWSLAPYADATIATPAVTTGTTTATVRATVTAGTSPQTVSVRYGTTPTLTSSTTAGAVAVSATGTEAATVTVSGLSANTTYYYRVVATAPVKPGSPDTVTTKTTIGSFTTAFDVTSGATADLTAAVGYLTSPANLANSTHYDPFGPTFPTVGLTIDGALGLAAAKTADPTLAMVTTWVAHNADSWTGIATPTFPPSGGALGKEALLAEVVGQDPHDFGGHDLIAAIDRTVCPAAGATCVAAGNYTDSSSVFDQALGVLAQLRAGDTTNAASSVAYLESLQKPDGAWSGTIPASTTTTVDSTAMAVMALDLTPSATAQLAVQSGLEWIFTQQQGDGGFTGASGISTNSTALAVMALGTSTSYATQIAAAQSFLAAEQNPDGGFTAAVGTATGSNLRASTQAVDGAVGTSFGTLSDPLTGPTPPAPPTGSTTANGGSSSTPTGTATAALPPTTTGAPSPVAASGTGTGALTVAKYAGNPTTGAVSGGTGVYYDVKVATASAFSSVTVTACTLGPGGQSLTWWNGTAWAPFSEQAYATTTGCVTATVSATTSPTPAQLTGTPVAPSSNPISSSAPAPPSNPTPPSSPTPAPTPTSPATPSTTGGYWEVASDGGLFAFGDAAFYGSMGGQPLNQPIVGIAATPDGQGYWEVASDGGLFAFGDAVFYGSMGGKPLNKPVVGLAATPDGHGYWEVASDGGLFAFGDAAFYGSMGGQPLNQPIVGVAATPDGHGYWEVASDGGLFALGDAAFYGSMGGQPLDQPIVGLASTSDGHGYWEVASDGGLFAFGDAAFYGSMGSQHLSQPIVGIAPTPDGQGYWEVASDGGLFAFGDAPFDGSMGSKPLNEPIIGMAAS
jgi:squalene-hopene cyclase-like protein